MDNSEKSYLNKDLFCEKSDIEQSIKNDFIGSDFVEQLEWAMLLIQSNFKQIRFAEYLPPVTRNHFDKAYLMTSGLNETQGFFAPLSDLQANPEMFPNLNIKYLLIDDTITLGKYKELPPEEKRNLRVKRKYAYERSIAFYKKDTESFYGVKEGYEVNPLFFKPLDEITDTGYLPNPISLHPNYRLPENAIRYMPVELIAELIKGLAMSYQIAFSMYYEWSIYIKEYDNVGFVIPIEPEMLSEIYKTSLLNFSNKKSMLHFVKDHYRRKVAKENEDYSIYVQKYLRGEHKFNYRGFHAEIIPPKYDLGRVKTKKKFINPMI